MIGTTLEENLRMIADSVAYCKEQGREVMYDAEHCFDGFKHNPEYAMRTLEAAAACRSQRRDPVRYQWRHAARGNRAKACARSERLCLERPSASIATTIATSPSPTRSPPSPRAPRQVQGTINGIGERCGNVDLISVIANLSSQARLRRAPSGQPALADRSLALRL